MSLDWDRLAERIRTATGAAFRIDKTTAVSGGCIHHARILHGTNGERYFLKYNHRSHLDAFAGEADGLEAIAATGSIRAPKPILLGTLGEHAFLVLEYIAFDASRKNWVRMGEQLADLHRHSAPTFGWQRDNWIGSTPQINRPSPDWPTFFRDCRLAPQIELAARQGMELPDARRLLDEIPRLLGDHSPAPALVHGDLWCGNVGFSAGQPVLFDPAIHFADRECDLAMARLFGGFPVAFHQAYDATWPLPADAHRRRPLYQLYHVLNHANLFGGAYRQQAKALIHSILRA